MNGSRDALNGSMTGSLVGAVFGLVYVLVNAGDLPSAAVLPVRVLGGLAFLGVLVAMARHARDHAPAAPRPGTGRRYGLLVAAEVAAILLGLSVLDRVLDIPHAGVAWVSVVVGLHFVPLGAIFEVPFFRRLGVAVALCGAGALALAATGAAEGPVSALGGVLPGALLLAGSWWGAVRDLRVPGSSRRPGRFGPDHTGAAGSLVWAGATPSNER